MHLREEDGSELVKLARYAIENYLVEKNTITAQGHIAMKYKEKAGVFVTLTSVMTNPERLRGCIGFPNANSVLHVAVINAAIASATNDLRFKPVVKEELGSNTIEISVLTQPQQIVVKDPRQFKEKIKIGNTGLIVKWRYGSGLLLPQVPVEYG